MDKHSGSEKIILRLDRGEEITSSLIQFCHDNHIESAWISGLGLVQNVALARYDLVEKRYFRTTLQGDYELASLTGNISQLEGKLVAHLHASVADGKMNLFGGHLDQATVAVTCEILIDVFEHPIERKYDEEIGLNLIA